MTNPSHLSKTAIACNSDDSMLMRRKQLRRWLRATFAPILIFGTLGFGNQVMAQDWAFATNGDWSDSTKWTGGVVPDSPTSVVNISQAGTPYTVNLLDNRVIQSLVIGSADATLSHTGGTLALSGSLTVTSGAYQLAGGTLSGGTLNPANVRYQSGTLDGVAVNGNLVLNQLNGGVTLSGGSSFSGNAVVTNNSSLWLGQDMTLATSLNLGDSTTGGALIVQAGNTLTIDSAATVSLNNGGGLYTDGLTVNNGSVGLTSTGSGYVTTYSGGGQLTNNGLIYADAGGTLQLQGGNLFDNAASGQIVASNASTIQIDGAWTNAGLIRVADSTSTINLGGSFSNATLGTVDNTAGGTLNVTGAWDNASSFAFNSTTGSWTLAGGTITGGTLTNSVSDRLLYYYGTLDGVTVNGDLVLDQLNGGVTLTGNSSFSGNAVVTNNSTLTVDEALTIAAGQSVRLGTESSIGAVNVAATGSLAFQSGSALVGNGYLFSSNNTVTQIDGELSPGNSVGSLQFFGDFALGSSALTRIELDTAGFDTIHAFNNFGIGGNLAVSLIPGFSLTDGLSFQFLTIEGNATGLFNNLAQDSVVGSFSGFDLRIDYQAGSGNDVRLYSAISAVPEPSSLAIIGVALLGFTTFRRARSETRRLSV